MKLLLALLLLLSNIAFAQVATQLDSKKIDLGTLRQELVDEDNVVVSKADDIIYLLRTSETPEKVKLKFRFYYIDQDTCLNNDSDHSYRCDDDEYVELAIQSLRINFEDARDLEEGEIEIYRLTLKQNDHDSSRYSYTLSTSEDYGYKKKGFLFERVLVQEKRSIFSKLFFDK